MTSPNKSFFRVTSPLCGKCTSHQWIPLTKGQWCGPDVSLMWVRISCLTNSRMTCDFFTTRRSCDGIVMLCVMSVELRNSSISFRRSNTKCDIQSANVWHTVMFDIQWAPLLVNVDVINAASAIDFPMPSYTWCRQWCMQNILYID